ncbi:hypothetical protein D3C81_1713450 [compost metagenome]
MTAMPQSPKGQNDRRQGILARTGSHLREGVQAQLFSACTDRDQGMRNIVDLLNWVAEPYQAT